MVAQDVAMATITSYFVQKPWPSDFDLLFPCATVSTLSHDSSSNSPQTQWVAMVAQAVAMTTMTSYIVQKPWPSDFDLLFPCATISTLSHDSASNYLQTH